MQPIKIGLSHRQLNGLGSDIGFLRCLFNQPLFDTQCCRAKGPLAVMDHVVAVLEFEAALKRLNQCPTRNLCLGEVRTCENNAVAPPCRLDGQQMPGQSECEEFW